MRLNMGHKALISLCLTVLLGASCTTTGKPDDDAYRLIKPAAEQSAGVWAIIDKEGDATEIVPEEGIAYEVEPGLSRQQAMDRAMQSVPVSELSIQSIPGPSGQDEIGIQVLPGEEKMKAPPNIVRIEYRVDETGRLRFKVRLLPLYTPAPAGSQ